jgi:probable phosphomutase (TIGR03848 family)
VATILLIRHAYNDWIGARIAGWTPGVHLNERGREQARRLGERLGSLPIRAIYSSPLERATETAAPLAERLGLEIRISEALGEVRFGEWTGKSMEELDAMREWTLFNSFRSVTRPPGGETAVEIQARMLAEIERLRAFHPDEMIVLVSHADVIRATLVYFAAIPLDLFHRIQIAPASVSILKLKDGGVHIARVNDTGDFSGL